MGAGVRSATRAIPLLGQLGQYSARSLRADIVAALVISVTLLPQALGYGALAGLPPAAGLYTALGAATVFALLTRTRFVSVGPSSTLALLTFSVVHERAGSDVARATALAAVLSLLMGMWCLVGAALRLQGFSDFLSAPVMLGYQAGVAVEVIAGQLGPLLGVATHGTDPLGKMWQVCTHLEQVKPFTAAMGLGAVVALVLLKRCVSALPGGLVVCLTAIALSAAFGLARYGVAVVGPVSGGPPSLARLYTSLEDVWALLIPAAGMALVASVETVSAVRRTTGSGEHVSLDRESAALGASSIASGALGGFPPMASTSRSLSARGAGAHSQLFSLVAAGIVVFVLFTGGPIMALLPMAVLSAIVIVGAPKLVDVPGFVRLWRSYRVESVIALISMAGVLAFGVLVGLLVAVVLSVAQLLRRAARPHDAVLSVTGDDGQAHELAGRPSPHPDILIYRADAPLFFANAAWIRQRLLTSVAAGSPPPRCVILDFEAVFYMDATAADVLAQLTLDLRALGCRVALARVHEPVLGQLRANPYHDGATQRLPVFPSVREAFTAMREP
ncbi:SulP family inorganic anion transporter [Nonomuraea sp. bgisy101]|uniref:SulP family inorganic anion transporter n=1 Tax=Nonomuraea sp. bgisy101 TaxID=3413784 RepID=UPI003D70BF5D